MKRKNILIKFLNLIFLSLFFLSFVNAFYTNSTTYSTDAVTTSGGEISNSTDYSTDVILGIISGYTNSTTYSQSLGFYPGVGVPVTNNPPTTPTPTINSTDGSNFATQNLNCYDTIIDSNGDKMNVTVTWYNNDAAQFSLDFNNSYSSGANFNAVLNSGNTTVGDVWKCGLRLHDGTDYSSWGNSSSLTIITTPVSPGGGGGGGGGGTKPKLVYTLDELKVVPESFNLPARVGVTTTGKLSILNTGGPLALEITLTNLEDIVKFEKTKFNLDKNTTEVLEFTITPPNFPGIVTGKIVINSGNRKLEIPFALNVESEMSLFDISIDIPDEYRIVDPGKNVKGQITLIQAGFQESVDVTMIYSIKDFDGNDYMRKTETIQVYQQKSYEYEFDTSELPPGDFIIGAEVIYSGGVATASHQFEIRDIEKKKSYYPIILELILAILLIIALILLVRRYKKRK